MLQKKSREQETLAQVVVCDPPWSVGQKGRWGAGEHYDLMTTDSIAAMPVDALVTSDATLFLWVTNATLEDGLRVMRAWGFVYKSHLVWDKSSFGLGAYFRNGHEILLHGIRGRAPWVFHGQRSVVQFPRMGHSVKPAEMVSLIERLFPPGTRFLELFARERPNSLANWSVWGLEASGGSDISIPGYPVPSDFDEQEVT